MKRTARVAALIALLLSAMSSAATAMADPDPAPATRGSLPAGILADLLNPGSAPPGANNWDCKPSASHPRPVILLHGFFANMTDSWTTVSPLLARKGYCVFALTYGKHPVDPTGTRGGLDYIENSSKELKAFTRRVLEATDSSKVDLVGWSEGGWLARQYIQLDGGDEAVKNVVGLAPANGPTNISQILFKLAGVHPLIEQVRASGGSAVEVAIPLAAQAIDPHVFAELNQGGGTSPQVHYTHIASRYDELVPPSSAFVPTGEHVKNIVLQRGCAIDFTDHLSIITAPRTMQFMLNALDPSTAKRAPCLLSLPLLG
ncbi:MAG: lipase family protein [Nocardioides sp.]|nr:lipase family protein [Nocardioides sp.]